MSDDENKYERDKKYEEAKQTESNTVKINFALDRLKAIEDRLDNGMSEMIRLNTFFRNSVLTVLTGLAVAWIAGLIQGDMNYSDTEISDQVAARVYYTKFDRKIYLVDNKTGEELAEVNLLQVDLGNFIRIIKESDKNTGGDL